jgi:hypothetical protein
MNGPGYWMHETSGVLAPAIKAYLEAKPLTDTEIATIRAYLRQWIIAPVWLPGPGLERLRQGVNGLTTRAAIDRWLKEAIHEGTDPL